MLVVRFGEFEQLVVLLGEVVEFARGDGIREHIDDDPGG